jgi:mRNA interferase RelE/StbE
MYRVVIDELVFEKDIKNISHPERKRMFRTIRNKLTTNPKEFGVPLRGRFSSFWKLRIGPYRVIYEIEEAKIQVYVIMIGFRRNAEVYRKLLTRLDVKQRPP